VSTLVSIRHTYLGSICTIYLCEHIESCCQLQHPISSSNAKKIQDGGFLQWGSPNDLDLRSFLTSSPCKCIIVAPAYRLNIFGFLASSSLNSCSDFSTNLGFWDQRLALQWTYENISYFGGNVSNITLGGYSAGSHSVFHQLAYDLGVPVGKAVVKRAMMLSNGPGVQPKSLDEAQDQYAELLSVLDIPTPLSPKEQLIRLRSIPAKLLIRACHKLKLHQFRAVTDGSFVRPNLLAELSNGLFASRMKTRNLHLIIGECSDEHFVYGTWHTPSPGYANMLNRLHADYPLSACKVLMQHYFPKGQLPSRYKTWQEVFGHIYADVQIHSLMRGMVKELHTTGAGGLVHRYRIEYRLQCVDDKYPKNWGVTHASDMPIWFWGNGASIKAEEEVTITKAFHEPLSKFLKGERMEWGTNGVMDVRTLKGDGRVVVEDDGEKMEEGLRLWEKLKSVGAMGPTRESKL
jgi:carboxylesterase type B